MAAFGIYWRTDDDRHWRWYTTSEQREDAERARQQLAARKALFRKAIADTVIIEYATRADVDLFPKLAALADYSAPNTGGASASAVQRPRLYAVPKPTKGKAYDDAKRGTPPPAATRAAR